MCPKCKSTNFKICSDTLKCKKCGLTQKGHEAAVKGWRTRKTLAKRQNSRLKHQKAQTRLIGTLLCILAFTGVLALPFQSSTVLYQKAYAQDVPDHIPEVSKMVDNPETVKEKIERISAKYDVDATEIYRTLDCESDHFSDPAIQAKFIGSKGRERSFGYAQIWLTGHPEVSYEQAIDPEFAITFIAKNWKQHKKWWACAKILGI